jgi:uncharacterized membrane protein YdjX (TVP38/TMEM64 family)
MNKNLLPFILVAIAATFLYFSTRVDEASLVALIADLGWYGPLILALFFLFTQIFAPLSGSLSFFVAVRLYGYANAALLFYGASLVSATLNFWIARRFGRAGIKKFVGEKALRQIDGISHDDEMRLLVVCRLFGHYLFDMVSYALGLTKLSFRTYFSYTAVLALVPITFYYFLFRDLDFSTLQGIGLYYGVLAISGGMLGWAFYKVLGSKVQDPS